MVIPTRCVRCGTNNVTASSAHDCQPMTGVDIAAHRALLDANEPEPLPSSTAAEKLRQASVLIAEVMDTLNSRLVPCSHCHRPLAVDRIEQQAHQALEQTREKLLDWADTLYLPRAHRDSAPAARRARARHQQQQRRPQPRRPHGQGR